MYKSIEVTIPVLNEEETLEEKVLELYGFMDKHIAGEFTIVIADNGSTDKTQIIAMKLANKYAAIKYLNVFTIGVGKALRESWLLAKSDIVGYMDLDLSTDLNHLQEVYKIFNTTNEKIVVGSRLIKGSKVIGRKLIREVVSRCFNFLLGFMLGVNYSDGGCGFKFFEKDVAQRLINKNKGITTDSWIFAAEMLAKAEWSGINIVEIAVKWTDDHNSKVKIVPLSWLYFKHILKLMAEKSSWKN